METRVQKYKEYRSSFVKEGSQNYNGQARYTTSTLPLNEVMSSVNDSNNEKEKDQKIKNARIFKVVIISVITVALIVGVVFLGIFAFKG